MRILPLILALAATTLGTTAQSDGQPGTGTTVPAMKPYYVMDPQAEMPVCSLRGPAGWKMESMVRWNFNSTAAPVAIGAALTHEESLRRVQFFPETPCYWLTGDAALNRPGQYNFGMLNIAPMEPEQTLIEAVTKIYQADVPDLRITGVRRVPGLAAAIDNQSPNGTGVGLRAEFTYEGTPMEEEIYAVHFISSATMRGEAGVTTQTNWGLSGVHGFIAPRGELDASRGLFTYIVRSVTPNPAWVQLLRNTRQQIETEWNQQLIDDRRAREAIMAQSRALAARNEAFRANIMARHRAAMNDTSHKAFIESIHSGGSAASGGGMSAQEKYVDSIHDRETFHDPSTVTGTSQHGYSDHHWSDGWGNYLHTDDPTVDPNIGSTIQWQQLERVE